jgi:hypothetical protein
MFSMIDLMNMLSISRAKPLRWKAEEIKEWIDKHQ